MSPVKRTAWRVGELLCLIWWIFAVCATYSFTANLPRMDNGAVMAGCHLASDWFRYVDCGQGQGGRILAGALTWGLLWTMDFGTLMQLARIPVLIPIAPIWIGSAVLAAMGLTRALLWLHDICRKGPKRMNP